MLLSHNIFLNSCESQRSHPAGVPSATSAGHQNNTAPPSGQLIPHDGLHRLAAPSTHSQTFSQILPSSLLDGAATCCPSVIDSLHSLLQEQEMQQALLSHSRALNATRKTQLQQTMAVAGMDTDSALYHRKPHAHIQSSAMVTCPRESTFYTMKDQKIHSPKHPLESSSPGAPSYRGIPQAQEGDARGRLGASDDSEADEEDAAMVLSALMFADKETFTEEEEAEKERATMTNEERAAALSDMFEEYCAVDSHQTKRARKDLDVDSVHFLILQMRVELERIPSPQKEALMEAQAKCEGFEFSDERLERYLRCEGMNAKLGANRFAHYWKCRREVFGSEKYILPVTLSGALRDDLEAIQDGMLCILPYRDLSGRQLLYLDEKRRSKGASYSSESLLRALWYTMEVVSASLNKEDVCNGVVSVSWAKGVPTWECYRVFVRFLQYEQSCFPMQRAASHVCCPPSFLLKVVRPVVTLLWISEAEPASSFTSSQRKIFWTSWQLMEFQKSVCPLRWAARLS